MRYRTNSLIKSYAGDLAAQGGLRIALAAGRLKKELARGSRWLATWLAGRWEESLIRRYFLCLGQDSARFFCGRGAGSYVGACLSICGLMSLGFLVINPPAARPSHQVRVDMSRPMVIALSAREAMSLNSPSAYDLAYLNSENGWFSSGFLSYEEALDANSEGAPFETRPTANPENSWLSSRSPLAVENGRVVLRTALGSKSIPGLGDVRVSGNITERPKRGLTRFASGAASPENLLAELTVQGLETKNASRLASMPENSSPEWKSGNYGLKLFQTPRRHWSGQHLAAAGPERAICPQSRMEQASWLNMLHASHTRRSIYTAKQAGHYQPFVERYAGHYSLQPSLVYAIMRVESGFNPLAVSRANALGLMQVVPETAGNEVNAFLSGKKIAPKPEVLFTPESNIEYGTTYLHLLTTRHFKDVKNPISRELCIIAAYNGGPNAVYRVFNRKRELAVQQINKLTPEQLYAKLLTGLSSPETRDYLPKVLAARNGFLRGQAKIQ